MRDSIRLRAECSEAVTAEWRDSNEKDSGDDKRASRRVSGDSDGEVAEGAGMRESSRLRAETAVEIRESS